MEENTRSAAQLFYDAFKKVEEVIKSDDDLMMFRKNGVYYVGDEDHFFVGAFPLDIAEKYYQDRIIERLVKLAKKDEVELLEVKIKAEYM